MFPTKIQEVKRRVERLEQMRVNARADYRSTMKEYYVQLQHAQARCPHPEWKWYDNATGRQGHTKTCKICGYRE